MQGPQPPHWALKQTSTSPAHGTPSPGSQRSGCGNGMLVVNTQNFDGQTHATWQNLKRSLQHAICSECSGQASGHLRQVEAESPALQAGLSMSGASHSPSSSSTQSSCKQGRCGSLRVTVVELKAWVRHRQFDQGNQLAPCLLRRRLARPRFQVIALDVFTL